MNQERIIVIGTSNRKKGIELSDLFRTLPVKVHTLADYPPMPPVEENGSTFAANAVLKASGYARQLGRWVLADDSGLIVDVLGDEPGVHSARYAGIQATDADNNRVLLAKLAHFPPDRRAARFVCHMALADAKGVIRAESDGICRGQILHQPRGGEGFGYDPLFEIPEYHRTFAELGVHVKAHLSHRARAALQMRDFLATLF